MRMCSTTRWRLRIRVGFVHTALEIVSMSTRVEKKAGARTEKNLTRFTATKSLQERRALNSMYIENSGIKSKSLSTS